MPINTPNVMYVMKIIDRVENGLLAGKGSVSIADT